MTTLHEAVKDSEFGIVTALLEQGTDPNIRDGMGRAPLHYATSLHIASSLIGAGAYMDARDCRDCTPLHYVAMLGRTDLAILYLLFDAPIDASDAWGNTPLHYAAMNKHDEFAVLLITEGANGRIKNNKGVSAEDIMNENCE